MGSCGDPKHTSVGPGTPHPDRVRRKPTRVWCRWVAARSGLHNEIWPWFSWMNVDARRPKLTPCRQNGRRLDRLSRIPASRLQPALERHVVVGMCDDMTFRQYRLSAVYRTDYIDQYNVLHATNAIRSTTTLPQHGRAGRVHSNASSRHAVLTEQASCVGSGNATAHCTSIGAAVAGVGPAGDHGITVQL